MMPTDDDGLACVEMRIATKAHLCGQGFDFRHAFAIFVLRADGGRIDLVSEAIENVAAMVAELDPPQFGLSIGPQENYAQLFAAIRGNSARTLH